MKKLIALGALALAAACGPAQTPQQPPASAQALPEGLAVRDPWAAPTPGGVDVAAGYITIANGGPADTLVAVASPRAASVMIHEMSMDGAIMRMRAVEGGLAIPPQSAVTLAPGGGHLMFMGVSQPFVEGEEIPVTLTFSHAGVREVMLPVRAGAAGH